MGVTVQWDLDRFCFVGILQALEMGLINTVVPLEKLEEETMVWCREILRNSPTALRVLKAALNAAVRGPSDLRLVPHKQPLFFYL